jgi:hypothetical protein
MMCFAPSSPPCRPLVSPFSPAGRVNVSRSHSGLLPTLPACLPLSESTLICDLHVLAQTRTCNRFLNLDLHALGNGRSGLRGEKVHLPIFLQDREEGIRNFEFYGLTSGRTILSSRPVFPSPHRPELQTRSDDWKGTIRDGVRSPTMIGVKDKRPLISVGGIRCA